jgi:hypothetical protein
MVLSVTGSIFDPLGQSYCYLVPDVLANLVAKKLDLGQKPSSLLSKWERLYI